MTERRTPYRTKPAQNESQMPTRAKKGTSTPAQRGDAHRALQRLVRDYLERCCHAYVFAPTQWAYQAMGTPDILACVPAHVLVNGYPAERPARMGVFVGVEIKTGKAQLHGKQPEVRDKILAAGGIWVLARTLDDVADALLAAGLDAPPLQ